MTSRTPAPDDARRTALATLRRNRSALAAAVAAEEVAVLRCWTTGVTWATIATVVGMPQGNTHRRFSPLIPPVDQRLPLAQRRAQHPHRSREAALTALTKATAARVQAHNVLADTEIDTVAAALGAGASWPEIATAVGQSRGWVLERFGRRHLQVARQVSVSIRG